MNRRRGNAARVAWNGLDIFLILLMRKMHEVLATNPLNPHPDFRILSPQWRQNFYGTPSKINNDYRRSQQLQTEPGSERALRQEEEALGEYFGHPENTFDDVGHENFSFKDASYMEEAAEFDKKYNTERSVYFDETRIHPRYHYQNQGRGPSNQRTRPNNPMTGFNSPRMGYNNPRLGPNSPFMAPNNYPVQHNPAKPNCDHRLIPIKDVQRLSPEDQQKCIAKIVELEQIDDFCNIASQVMHIVELLKQRSGLVRLLLQKNVKHANIGRPSLITVLNRMIRQLSKTNEKMKRMLSGKGKPVSNSKQPKYMWKKRRKSSTTVITTVVRPTQTTPLEPESTASATTITQTTMQETTSASTVPSTEETSTIVETTNEESPSTSESTSPDA